MQFWGPGKCQGRCSLAAKDAGRVCQLLFITDNLTKLSALASAALLAHPSPSAPIALTTDASVYAMGAVCEQWVGGVWQPLPFSASSFATVKKYCAFDGELLVLFLATRHFRFLLEGRLFTVFVDHKPLTFTMSKTLEPWSGCRQQQLSAISEFTTDIQQGGQGQLCRRLPFPGGCVVCLPGTGLCCHGEGASH